MFAFVRFLEDNVCYALPATRVWDFQPRSTQDFDNRKVYAVYRSLEEEAGFPVAPQRAQILALAGVTAKGNCTLKNLATCSGGLQLIPQ
ncbi:hypothetical protein XELAEV_18035046mg [Xenopus laevis]|uniref:Uncharacterized protein n=1 Tax=Xenopus laevis TaxID=8355 RepID=A0A974CEZ0_XENLA|nr:hypothetical protein XELAEV_18035046mg [Xenopus laevis]